MVKNTSKILLSILASLVAVSPVGAASVDKTINEGFEVNLKEVLTVTVDLDHTQDTGSAFDNDGGILGDIFLKDIATVRFTTNNALGYSATMTTKAVEKPAEGEVETSLKMDGTATITIPTLTKSVTSEASFPANYWGFSLNGSDATTAVYNPLQASDSANPSVVAYANAPTDELRTIYFGTKGNADTVAGTYRNTVVISITAPPEYPPEDVPTHDDPTPVPPQENNAPKRSSAPQQNDEEQDAGEQYEEPKGANEDTTTEVIDDGSSKLGMSLAVGFTTTVASGIVFFVLAKRKEDDEDNE